MSKGAYYYTCFVPVLILLLPLGPILQRARGGSLFGSLILVQIDFVNNQNFRYLGYVYPKKPPSKTFTQTLDFLPNSKTSHSVVCSRCEGDIVVGPLYFFEEDGVNVTNSSELWTTGQTVQLQRGFSLIKTVVWLFSHDDICKNLYVFK